MGRQWRNGATDYRWGAVTDRILEVYRGSCDDRASSSARDPRQHGPAWRSGTGPPGGLPAHLRRWSVSLATLNAPKLVHDRCRDLGVDLVTPESPWDQPVGGLDEVTAAAGRSARRAWRSLRTSAMGTTLDVAIELPMRLSSSSAQGRWRSSSICHWTSRCTPSSSRCTEGSMMTCCTVDSMGRRSDPCGSPRSRSPTSEDGIARGIGGCGIDR